MNSDKYSNHASFFPTQQAPLVFQAHLLSVVRKVEKSERFKGKKQPEFVVKNLSPSNREKLMTSLSLSRQKAEGENQQDSVYTNRRKSETDQIIPIYQYKKSMYSLKPSESGKEQKESQFKLPGLPNRHYAHDVMDDGINRGRRREIVNRPVARKRYAASKHSSSHVKEGLNSSLTISKQFLVQLAIISIMVINVIRSGLNMNLLKLVWVVGLAVVVCQECVGTRCTTTTADQPQTFPRYSFGGKHFNAYILPSTNVYASWMDYFGRYIRNLESESRIMRFYKLIYLYICAFDLSWVSWEPVTLSSKIATLASDILYTLVYLLSKWINSVIRIHDEYQSCFLVGLALTCKASSQIQYILLHFRTNWRELRPLVTPWANGIKESFKPCIDQKQFMPSHAQVSHFPLSLLYPSLLLLCFGCCYYYYYYYCCYEYFTVKGLYKSSGYENKSSHKNSNDYEYKTVPNLLSLFLLSSLPMLLTAVCGAGDLAHTVSPAHLCLLLSFSLLMTAVCGAGDLAHTASPAFLYILLSFSLLMSAVCGAGDLAHTVSPARSCLLLSFSLLMTAVCGAGDLAHTASPAFLYILLSFSLLMTAVCGAGDLARTVSPARLCLLLSFSLLMTAVCGTGDLAHTASPASLYIWPSFSLLLTIVCGAGDLAHAILPAYFLDNPFFSLTFDGHWLVMCANAAVVLLPLGISATKYPPITLLQEDIHSFRDDMLLAIGTFYMLSYRTVGMKIDGNCCPYLLSPTAPAPRTRCLGRSVARFAKPFESRPADTVRRELYKQLATQPGHSGWIAPTAALPATPRPLERATEACFAPRKGLKCKRRLQF